MLFIGKTSTTSFSIFCSIIVGITMISSVPSQAQKKHAFEVVLEPMTINGFKGLQSFAWASDEDKILLVGGREDGLHKRQPFASFNPEGNNTEIIVLDITKRKIYKASVLNMNAMLAAQLQSSNMEFYQNRNELILVGGYGYSAQKDEHVTHPAITILQVKELINAIVENKDITSFIKSIQDERMAVTGGRLSNINDTFYLVGGQRFDGKYNPHGPDHGPGFTQQYTNQIRKFTIASTNEEISILNYSEITDSLLLHRRDYNLLPQMNANNKEMLTVFSGVFQYDKDLPYTTLIDITAGGITELKEFNQLYNHYHTASLAMYDSIRQTMFSVFFGGIAQYYKNASGKTIKDDNVPFTSNISVIERRENYIQEYVLNEQMPGYLGASAEFIPAQSSQFNKKGILQITGSKNNSIFAGYIIGGIKSKARNVFWSNDNNSSSTSTTIWRVIVQLKNNNEQ